MLTGQGARFMRPTDNEVPITPSVVRHVVVKPPEDCSIEDLSLEIIRRALAGIKEAGL